MDIRREMDLINRRGYDFYQEKMGEVVMWHEFDTESTDMDHLYDEGGKRYQAGVLVPVLWIIETDPPEINEREGRRYTPTIRFAVPKRKLEECGISNVADVARHLNDMVVYRNTYWAIGDFAPHGRLRENLVIGVNATKVYVDDEMISDTLPQLTGVGTTHRPTGEPNDDYATQVFPFHEDPALQALPDP